MMLKLIEEVFARGFAFRHYPFSRGDGGVLECEEYAVMIVDGKYRVVDTVSPVTATLSTPVEVMTFIQTNMDK